MLVAGGVEVGALRAIQQALQDAGASSRIVAAHLGSVATSSGQQLAVDHTFANMPSVMFDAVLVPGGAASAQTLAGNGDAVHFVLEAYKHCKAICVIGEGVQLLRTLGIGARRGRPRRAGRGARQERSAGTRRSWRRSSSRPSRGIATGCASNLDAVPA